MTTTETIERKLSRLVRYASSAMRFTSGFDGIDRSLESDLVDAAGALAVRINKHRLALDPTDPTRPWI